MEPPKLRRRWRKLEDKYKAAGGLAVLFSYEAAKTMISALSPSQSATALAFVAVALLSAAYHLLRGVDLTEATSGGTGPDQE